MKVVVVELPAKAKTINKYLGSDYKVVASYGHVRDLPAKDGSVLPDADFAMSWEVDGKSEKHLKTILEAVRGADRLFLATDPDREGEAISWHVSEVLNSRRGLKHLDIKRVVFNEVTKNAVLDAFTRPREIDRELVEAYLARRALDYLVGFTLSPVLWRKLPGSRSAGRVQSVALRLVCERESEIEAFKSREYWTIEVEFKTEAGQTFTARLTHLDGKRLERFDLDSEAKARAAADAILRASGFTVAEIDSRQVRRNPFPPFTTSTLQQEASRKLGLSANRTMQIAQRLYEGIELAGETVGLITYMRTDGVAISAEAIAAARQLIGGEFGPRYLTDAPRVYRSPAKNAQEAHEAIRPTDLARKPADVARHLDRDQLRLYELIWKRTVASQMASALLEQVAVDIADAGGRLRLRANGSVILFDGFLTLYQEDRDDTADEEGEGGRLPAMREAERLARGEVTPSQHFTQPPPRYTEASLVKKLEELGIGRPSTYASILQVLQDRDYVRLEKRRFIPEDRGRLVTAFLANFFERYVEYNFTADLENQLDDISGGRIDWKEVLRNFWRDFSAAIDGTKELTIGQVLSALDEALGRAFFPERRLRERPPPVSGLRHRPAQPQARQIRRLHRLFQLPELPPHPAAGGGERDGHRRSGDRARHRPRDRIGGHAEKGPLWPLCAARRRQRRVQAQAGGPAPLAKAGRDRSRDRIAAARVTPRARPTSRNGRCDRRRHRPLRCLYQARNDLQIARRRRRRADDRAEPRGRTVGGTVYRAAPRAAAGPRTRRAPRWRHGRNLSGAVRPLCQP